MKNVLPLLKSDRTLIRLANGDDVTAIVNYYSENRQHLTPFEPLRTDDFYTEAYWHNEVEQRLTDASNNLSLKLFIFAQDHPQEILGTINFANFVRGVFQSCTLGYSIADFAQGKGYMTESLKVAIDYLFNEWNLHRIMAAYLPHNQRSARILKRLGFLVEGYAYEYLLINGKWQDHILTSLINRDWKLI